MHTITKATLLQLTKGIHYPAISLYFPLPKAAKPAVTKQRKHLFTLLLQRAHEQLIPYAPDPAKRDELLAPAQALLAEDQLWKAHQGTIAVFLQPQSSAHYLLPYAVMERLVIGTRYYLLPIITHYCTRQTAMLLALSLQQVALYQVSAYNYVPLDTQGLLPTTMEMVTGSDYEQQSLQTKGQHTSLKSATFFGHGAGTDDRQQEQLAFLQAIDKGLQALDPGRQQLLAVAATIQLGQLFKRITRYRTITLEGLQGNPFTISEDALITKAQQVLAQLIKKQIKEQVNRYTAIDVPTLKSNNPRKIGTAAHQGQIDCLFVQESASWMGKMSKRTGRITIPAKRRVTDEDLLNEIAIRVFLHGGSVYLVDDKAFPDDDTPLHAIYRYA